jgi:O-antigen ligase
MRREVWAKRLSVVSYCLLGFSIPFPFLAGSVAIIILLAAFIVSGSWRGFWQRLGSRPALWIWLLYYGWHLASYFWSANKEEAQFVLTAKLSFLIMPLIVGARGLATTNVLRKVLAAFTWGTFAVACFCLLQAVGRFQSGHDPSVFFYHDLVKGLEANAVYSAWYVFFALSIVLLGCGREMLLQKSWLRYAVTTILFVYFSLLAARTLFVLFFLIPLPVFIYRQWKIRSFQGGRLVGVCLLAVAILAGVFFTNNPLRTRFADVGKSKMHEAFLTRYSGEQDHFSNLTVRVLLWRVGLENMDRHHLWAAGAGIGDVDSVQNQRMDELGLIDHQTGAHVSFRNVNLHNMVMQCLVTLGIPGALLFLILALQPFLTAYSAAWENRLWIVFTGVSFLFMMQEAALQTQAGIVFYSFFSALFWDYYYNGRAEKRAKRDNSNDSLTHAEVLHRVGA